MSKLLGKVHIETRGVEPFSLSDFSSLSIRYIKSSDSFAFRGFRFSLEQLQLSCDFPLSSIGIDKSLLVVPAPLLFAIVQADKIPSVVFKPFFGYKTKFNFDRVEDILPREREWLASSCGSETESSLSQEDLLDISLWQATFRISLSFLNSVIIHWKRVHWNRSPSNSFWLPVPKR